MEKRRKSLTLPTIRKFREAIEGGKLGNWLIEAGEKYNAGGVKVKYTLKDKPWIVEVIARRNYKNKK